MTDDDLPALTGPVEVVGAGLIGTSIALVCRRLGIEVVLRDTSEENLRTAHGLGAGRAATPDDRPQLVVVAVPPASVADAIVDALSRTDAVVTDVGSVKAAPLEEVAGRVGPDDLARYVGSHPMAGSERSGPLAASAALFDGRPWAVTPHADAPTPTPCASSSRWCWSAGPRRCVMEPGEHDRAVARISHLPHLAAVLVAGRLAAAPAEHLALSGQGVRDVTRVAASDPALWQQILEANSEAVLDLLAEVRADLDALMTAVASDAGPGPRRDPRPRQRRHGGDPRQARRPGATDPLGLRRRCPTTRASWPGSSATPARSASTSRTSTSTTTRAARSASPSSSSSAAAPSSCWPLSNPAGGRPTGNLLAREHRRQHRTDRVPRHRRRRHVRLGEVEHLARRGRPARPALPRHRRDVPGDDVVAAARGHRRTRRGGGRGRRRTSRASSPAPTRWRPTITVDGTDVSVEIRGDDVNAAVSPVSAVPEVRARLLDLQREVIGEGGIVVEGRDIGSVVWPQAEVKVYLSADPDARAQRRTAEQGGTDVASTQQSLLERDRIDSGRATAPLTMAEGAVHVDSTHLTLAEVIDRIVALAGGTASVTRADLPASADEHPATRLLRLLRPPAARLVRRRWPVVVHHADRVPRGGRRDPGEQPRRDHRRPAARGLLAPARPRADQAGDVRRDGSDAFLRASGQIPLDRFHADPGAIRSCLRVVRDGGVAGIFPEGTRGDGELRPLPPRCRLPRARHRRPGRAGHDARHPAARRRRQRPARRAATPSTWCSGGRGGRHSSPGHAPGNTWRPRRCCSGSTCCPSWPRALARHAPILARAASCGTIRGRPRHRARRAIQRAVITHD